MPSQVRTRFAPSPTGYLHIGGARTALFSWLFARAQGGRFVLRMEDTDQARSTQESADALLNDLRWLGLDWDEGPGDDNRSSVGDQGPYFQSQRTAIYEKYLQILKDKKLAYPSFETKEEVEAGRDASIAEGVKPVSSGMEADEAEVAEKAKQGIHPAWRFRIPDVGVTEWMDLVHGKTKFENRLMADIVIWRSDQSPTYNFAATVDDCLMGITHVLRGDDHLSNTPRQICIAQALDLELPAFGHFPMILGPDKQRLSKRHGATAVGEFRRQGFLAPAMVNFLALLGWSLDDKTTKISVDELKKAFSLERVGKSAAVFDVVKLEWLNGLYLRELPLETFSQEAWPLFVEAGLVQEADKEAKAKWFEALMKAVQSKTRKMGDLPEETRFFFEDFDAPQPAALEKFFEAGNPAAWLEPLAAKLEEATFDEASLETLVRGFADEKGMKFKQVVGPLRAALSGRTVTPGLFETLALLGKDRCVSRLRKACQWKDAGTPAASK